MTELTAKLDPNLMAGCWVQTYTGRAVHLLDPKPEEIDIRDIAHSLAHQFRYNGHTLRPITVAEHCIIVSNSVSSENALWGLLHDAAEFAVGDLVGPLKRILPEFSRIEAGIMRCICEKFGLSPQDEPTEVKDIDRRLLHNELLDLMAAPPKNWALTGAAVPGVFFNCWEPKLAEAMFLARFEELTTATTLLQNVPVVPGSQQTTEPKPSKEIVALMLALAEREAQLCATEDLSLALARKLDALATQVALLPSARLAQLQQKRDGLRFLADAIAKTGQIAGGTIKYDAEDYELNNRTENGAGSE